MDVLIIGNGFDLAHGLETSYKHFLDYCEDKDSKRIKGLVSYGTSFIDNIWLRHFITKKKKLGNNWIDLEQEIYDVIQYINETMYELSGGDFNIIFPIMFSLPKDILAFDFSNITCYIKSARDMYKVKKKAYTSVETNDFSHLYFYIENYNGFVTFLYDQLRELTKFFECYLTQDILLRFSDETIQYTLSLLADDICPKGYPVYVLSFNYTDICSRLYSRKCGDEYGYDITTYYVHGKVNSSDTCNLVLGTHSFNSMCLPVSFNVFCKHNQRHKYGTIEEYQDLLIKIKNERDLVFHVVGHSLDKTDHNILKHVFLANKNAIINIYYHNEEAQERLINNITNIIGEEEVMTKVRFIHQHDDKRGLLKTLSRNIDRV